MSELRHRYDVLFINQASRPVWGGSYSVTAYRPGAQASSAVTSLNIPVRAGHGFTAGDKLVNMNAADIAGSFRTVTSVALGQLNLDAGGSTLTVAVGDVLVNLGPDTGTVTPNYDGSDLKTYSDMAGAVQNTQNRVTADATGVYDYWTRSGSVWELVRNTIGVPVAAMQDVMSGAHGETGGVYNVKDYGAVGDGTTDDTAAFTRVRNLAELRQVANAAFDANANKVGRVYIEIPAGAFKITAAGAFMRTAFVTRTVGITFRGLGPKVSQILYQPSVSGALCQNNDAWQAATFEGIEFNCNDANSDFLDSISGGGAQDYRFVRCKWSGDWRYCFYLSAGTNNNSEWFIENCSWGGDYNTVLYIPSTLSDQELNFWFMASGCAINSGKFISAAKGGHFKFIAGDYEMLSTYTVDTYFIELLGSSHATGTTSLHMDGVRFELRDDNSRFLYCEWTHGIIRICGLDISSAYSTRTDTVVSAVFVGSGAGLPQIVWEQCKLIGRHEYQYAANGYLYPRRVVYRSCEMWQHADPDEFLLLTAVGGTTNLGSQPQIELTRCSFFEALAGEISDTEWNFRRTNTGLSRERVMSIKGASGSFPTNATETRYLPLGCVITAVELHSDFDDVAEANDATFTVQTGEGTPTVLATVTPSQHREGFDHRSKWWFKCDTDAKRAVSLVAAANVSNANAAAYCIIRYIG